MSHREGASGQTQSLLEILSLDWLKDASKSPRGAGEESLRFSVHNPTP